MVVAPPMTPNVAAASGETRADESPFVFANRDGLNGANAVTADVNTLAAKHRELNFMIKRVDVKRIRILKSKKCMGKDTLRQLVSMVAGRGRLRWREEK